MRIIPPLQKAMRSDQAAQQKNSKPNKLFRGTE
jgi:hypothetical protein